MLVMHDQADSHGLDAGLLAQGLGKGHLIAVADRRAAHRPRKNATGAAVDHIDADRLELASEHDAVVRAPAGIIIHRQAHEDRQVGRPVGAHAFGNFERKATTVGRAAAVLIGALIGLRRQKLMNQKTVGAMNFNGIESGRPSTRSRSPEGLHHLADFGGGERPRHRRIGIGRQGTGRNQFPGVPVVGHTACCRQLGKSRLGQGLAALPGPAGAGLAARVPQLDAGFGAAAMNEIDDPLEMRHEGVIPQAEVAHRAAAAPLDLGRLHHHQTDTARCIPAGIHQMPVGRKAADRCVLVHRRDDDPIAQRQAAKGHWGKQQRSGH